MNRKNLLLSAFLTVAGALGLHAQTDMTSSIVNPSFETNVDAMAEGWTFENGADITAWNVVNTDGDDTKDGANIAGLWNLSFGEEAITQTITGLANGVYTITADLTVPSGRLTTQRIFANDSSVLFATEADYTAENIAILTGTLDEKITYANYTASAAENGPFVTCSISTEVTDGTLKFGVKTNGVLSGDGLTFADAVDGSGFFKIDNFTLTLLGGETSAIGDVAAASIKAYASEGFIVVNGVDTYKVYNTNGVEVPASEQLPSGIYVVVAEGTSVKVFVQ